MNSINVSQVLTDLQPVADALLGILGTIIAGYITYLANKYVGYKFTDSQKTDFANAIEKFAAMEIAKAEGNLATTSITVTNPIVQNVAASAMAELPALVAKFNITPIKAAQLAQAALGRLQAVSTPVQAPIVVPAPQVTVQSK